MRNLTTRLLPLLGAAALVGCNADDPNNPFTDPSIDDDPGVDDPGTDDDDDTTSSDRALRGSVSDPDTRADLDGTVVALYEIDARGDLHAVADAESTTDASGEYTIELDSTDLETGSDLMVRAEIDGMERWVLVSGDLESDATVTVAPIDAETTAESRVYLSLAGMTGGSPLTTVEVRDRVDGRLGLVLETAGEQEVDAVAESLLTATLAVRASADAEAEADYDAAIEAMTDAMVTLDASLDGAESSSEVQAALETYADARLEAFTQAGFDLDLMADAEAAADESAEAESDAQVGVEISSDVQAALLAQTAMDRAEARAEALADSLVELSYSAEARAAVDAAVTELVLAIDAAAMAGAEAESTIDAARADFEGSVVATLQSGLSLTEQVAFEVVMTSLESAVAELHAELDSVNTEAGAEATAEAVVQAFHEFESTLVTEDLAGELEAAGMTEAHATVLVEIIAELSAMSHSS